MIHNAEKGGGTYLPLVYWFRSGYPVLSLVVEGALGTPRYRGRRASPGGIEHIFDLCDTSPRCGRGYFGTLINLLSLEGAMSY